MTSARSAASALIAARIACGIGLLAVLAAGTRMLRRDTPGGANTVSIGVSLSEDTGTSVLPAVELRRLIARDPFSPLREAPEVAYRIGGNAGPVAAAEVTQRVRLIGTVVRGAGRSFAMCQVGNEPARTVYPGQRVGDLTLESVTQGVAVFISESGARVVLRVPRTGA